MHSGIGPAGHLREFNIPVVKDIPAVGQNLADHPFTPLIFARDPATNDRNAFYGSEEAMDAAQKQWLDDHSGPWSRHGSQISIGWLKSEAISSSPEYAALPGQVQSFLEKPTIPHFEVTSHFPVHMLAPDMFTDYSYVCLAALVMNGQSRGDLRLQSSNPLTPLLCNPNILSHSFDQRVCIEATREILSMTKHPSFAKDTRGMIMGPRSESDEDILSFWKETCGSSWHMTGTARMGCSEEKEGSVVDSSFRVFGVQGLRAADLSVVPVLTNNHTQATAYVAGVACADILIREYGLD